MAGEDIGNPVAAMDANGNDTLTYSLGGTDMASFDHRQHGHRSCSMTLDDAGLRDQGQLHGHRHGQRRQAPATPIDVMVMVTNVDETGEVTLWAGTDAPLTMAPQVGETITGAVMDPDGGVTGETWQWSRTMDTADMNSWMDIQDATDAAYMVTAGDTGYYLRVMATYTDAAGTDMDMVYSMPTMMVTEMMGEVTLWAGTRCPPHDGAAGWRDNHGGRDGPRTAA